MALSSFASVPSVFTFTTRLQPTPSTPGVSFPTSKTGTSLGSIRIMANTKNSRESNIARRSANYQTPIWHFDYIQSLRSDFVGEPYARRINKLKENVKVMLEKEVDPIAQLEQIDVLQRLGLAYHFEDEVENILKRVYHTNFGNGTWKNNLYATALAFRLLRQHGYSVPQEVFNDFKDEKGNFKSCMCEDTMGMLYLYEASYHCIEGENLLKEARDFATKHLQEYVGRRKGDQNCDLSMLVNHALELPLHWRMLRLETRWFIDVYEKRQDMNRSLLELAELDFNLVQSIHQEDLKYASRWWRSTGLGENLSFARDRLMENFFWTVGVIFEPQFGYCRRMSTKVNALITVIDDIYDVYGTLDELELFTDVVERWDVNALDQLPDYMKICFLALHNTINEMAYDVLREKRLDILKYLKKSWADICKSYLLEAKWYYSGYKPTLQEYIENAWISISAPVILVHAFFFVTNEITEEALQCLEEYPNVIRWSSIILRLADDLGTSSDELKRGDVPKSIQCYMHETGASENEAREYIKRMIGEIWEKMNEDGVPSSNFSKTYIGIAKNLARMAQCMYQHGDGHGVQDKETKDRVLSLLINPISLHD
ncbi:myrcene synthase, chloroplastic [Ziziphus jujuba]|uniref:Myrcene synthase, chloroplastic n=1 Tax=Ziziphus jujuba TaxID=326968 RepID=A0A6P4A5M9_ZIZJJ|nr:myrcene synthase, chloroplastic [Ziziphus jujuba]